jgi:O-antigen ligase
VEEHPILGSGAGSYGLYWLRYRPNPSFAQDAHNLYLETLAELGPLGLGLLLAALAAPLVGARAHGDPLAATAAGGYAAFLVHAGVDWDWEVPAATLAGLFCAAALLVAGRPATTAPVSGRGRIALLAPTLALLVFATVRVARSGIAP